MNNKNKNQNQKKKQNPKKPQKKMDEDAILKRIINELKGEFSEQQFGDFFQAFIKPMTMEEADDIAERMETNLLDARCHHIEFLENQLRWFKHLQHSSYMMIGDSAEVYQVKLRLLRRLQKAIANTIQKLRNTDCYVNTVYSFIPTNVKNQRNSTEGGKRTKKVRKHRGIIQTGGNKGQLKKGYKYTGKRLKNGLTEIKKV
jgi:hypothetical protein